MIVVGACRNPEKRKHKTREAALAHIRGLYLAGRGNSDYVAYPCGDHWHIGHSQRRLRERIRAAVTAGSAKSARNRRVRSRR